MKTGGTTRYYYGLGLPESSAKIAIRRVPWQVAKKLLLYIFAVDKTGKVKQYSWQNLKKGSIGGAPVSLARNSAAVKNKQKL